MNPQGPPVVLVANQKGGVGKSALVSNVSVAVAAAGRRVLVIDSDQQANVTKHDIGVQDDFQDKGSSLASAFQHGGPLLPVTRVRERLDVVCGGPHLALVSAAARTADELGIDLTANLRRSLRTLCDRNSYDLVLVDTGPGDIQILEPWLHVATHLVVPTKEDEGSIDGVETLALRYLRARRSGSAITLLGVVLFDVNPQATSRNSDTLRTVADLLEGSGADVFSAIIRTDKATSRDQRTTNLTAQELIEVAKGEKAALLAALRAGRERDTQKLYSRDPTKLANDYQELTREILVRLSRVPALAGQESA